jgi:hypothetical protein
MGAVRMPRILPLFVFSTFFCVVVPLRCGASLFGGYGSCCSFLFLFFFLFFLFFLFLFVRANCEANLAAAFNLREMLHAAAVEGADEEDDEV